MILPLAQLYMILAGSWSFMPKRFLLRRSMSRIGPEKHSSCDADVTVLRLFQNG